MLSTSIISGIYLFALEISLAASVGSSIIGLIPFVSSHSLYSSVLSPISSSSNIYTSGVSPAYGATPVEMTRNQSSKLAAAKRISPSLPKKTIGFFSIGVLGLTLKME